jgi:peptidoglycan/xylan/chitin deacetylase (PgdA/CDA1 family)
VATPDPEGSDPRSSRLVTGVATATLTLPTVPAVADTRTWPWFVLSALAVAVAAATAWGLGRRVRRPGLVLAVLGGLLVAIVGWVLPQTAVSLVTVVLGLGLGTGVGIGGGGVQVLGDRATAAGAVVGVATLAVLVAIDGTHGTAWAGLLGGVAVVLAGVLRTSAPRERAPRAVRWAAAAVTVVTVGGALWIGANSPTETWFGSQVSHGPRDGKEVAITFDDGPSDPYTLEIAHILDEHDAKGTFFVVGKAVEERSDIVRELRNDGHLLGNHSYHHDSWRWLDPRYPELERTQRVLQREVGVCPTYYRAPHGQHTPFMAQVVDDHGMSMVSWDVSAGDWATRDARQVARAVLDGTEPGSIVLLHDGLDGDLDADRSVLVRALPIILDGLDRRGLKPVRLDRLLGDRGYGDHC